MRSTLALIATAGLVGLASACGSESEGAADLEVVRDTVGDTAIVHTVSGSVWRTPGRLVTDVSIGTFEGPDEYMFGRIQSLAVAPDGSIYVFDAQATELRKYAPDGTFLSIIGREGGGPGEYKNPDGGLAVMPDGRVLLRDPANGRINVYGPDGESLDTWPLRGGWHFSRQLYLDTAGYVYTVLQLNAEAGFEDWKPGLVKFAPDGTPVDTLEAPTWDYEEAFLTAQREGSFSRRSVPFAPEASWAFSPLGYMVGGLSTRYAIDLFLHDGTVRRIGRDREPVPVLDGERENEEERARAAMQRTDPGWRWDGPPIPETKAPFEDLFIGDDGRIWVSLHERAEPIPEDEIEEPDPDDPNAMPPRRWREPIVFDVFEPDGRYLGRVQTPEGFARYPEPVFRGDTVWAVVRGEFDVPYVQRLVIQR